jgi:hypothetical protein
MESPDSPELVPESSSKNLPEHENGGGSTHQSAEDSEENVLWPEYCNPAYRMPDTIEVKVLIDGQSYFFPVSIIKASQRKLYLGGYRNKLTGHLYHHAQTQTPTDEKRVQRDYSNLRTRETQTTERRTLSVQPYRESGTQMDRVDLITNRRNDRVLYSRSYFTSDELFVKKKAAVIEIQRTWRGCMARHRAQRTRHRNVEYEIHEREIRRASLSPLIPVISISYLANYSHYLFTHSLTHLCY